jgi:hydroxylamine reductase
LQGKLTGTLIRLAKSDPAMNEALDRKVIEGLFATVTNVNFSDEYAVKMVKSIEGEIKSAEAPYDMAKLWEEETEDVRSLKSLILFGIRGMAAYAYHALALGLSDEKVNGFFYKALSAIGNDALGRHELLPLALEAGQASFICMEMLDRANTAAYGTPSPTKVTQTVEPSPFIVVSGHDLRDLKLLLEQTKGRVVNVYTHCEMLPAHAYPELAKYSLLTGNFGTAWQTEGVCGCPSGIPVYLQLPYAAESELCRQGVHHWCRRLSGAYPYRRGKKSYPGNRKSACARRIFRVPHLCGHQRRKLSDNRIRTRRSSLDSG